MKKIKFKLSSLWQSDSHSGNQICQTYQFQTYHFHLSRDGNQICFLNSLFKLFFLFTRFVDQITWKQCTSEAPGIGHFGNLTLDKPPYYTPIRQPQHVHGRSKLAEPQCACDPNPLRLLFFRIDPPKQQCFCTWGPWQSLSKSRPCKPWQSGVLGKPQFDFSSTDSSLQPDSYGVKLLPGHWTGVLEKLNILSDAALPFQYL